MAIGRTYQGPRFNDAHSFFGTGRALFQKAPPDRYGSPLPTTPPIEGAQGVPTVPRG